MTNTQVTLIQLDNYGPWTVTPEPRPEPDLQALQSDLYADLSRLFGSRGAYVFFTRFDNMVAVTNGVDADTLAAVQETVGNRYPVSVSLSTATGASPAGALSTATARLQEAGGAQEAGRTEVLAGDPTTDAAPDALQVAHFDVVDATGRYTDRLDAFSSFARIEHTYVELLEHMHRQHDSLSFFVGGDNFISVTADLDRADFHGAVEAVEAAADVDLRVGVGRGAVATEAGMAAKHALEDARERDVTVAGDLPARAER
ncbi:MAG: GTP cyclohydrolase IIa [Halobacteriaceae archaeon]